MDYGASRQSGGGHGMNAPTPVARRFGPYIVENNHVLFPVKNGELLISTGTAYVAEPVLCKDTGSKAFQVQVQPVNGEAATILVWPEDMTPKYLKKVIGRLGVIIHDDAKFAHYLSMTASFGDFMSKTPRTLIDTPGWFASGRGYYTGRNVIVAASVKTEQFRFEPVNRAPFAVRGKLPGWKKGIGRLVERNPVLLAIACIFIASPFLKEMGLASRLVNIYGGKGTGKTICAQVGATIWGNGIDPAAGMFSEDAPYLTKFSTTLNGIEAVLAKYSPFPLGLDELTEQAIQLLGELLYKIASGLGKHRLTADLQEAQMNRWLLTIVSTSERSIADAVGAGGKPLLGGQQDRAIDIPVDNIGVISDFDAFDGFPAATRYLKAACGEFYGSAGEAILQYACDNPGQISTLIGEAQAIEERLMPINCGDGERRVIKFLAGAVVAGHIAIKAGVFDCPPETVEAAVKTIVGEWWHERGGVLRRIAEFLHANFDDTKEGLPKKRVMAAAFFDEHRVMIPEQVFEDEFGEDCKAILAELKSINALVREQPNRNKCRFDNNSVWAYVIKLDRLEPILNELSERDEAANVKASGSSLSSLDDAME